MTHWVKIYICFCQSKVRLVPRMVLTLPLRHTHQQSFIYTIHIYIYTSIYCLIVFFKSSMELTSILQCFQCDVELRTLIKDAKALGSFVNVAVRLPWQQTVHLHVGSVPASQTVDVTYSRQELHCFNCSAATFKYITCMQRSGPPGPDLMNVPTNRQKNVSQAMVCLEVGASFDAYKHNSSSRSKPLK